MTQRKISYFINGDSYDTDKMDQFIRSLFAGDSLILNGGYLFKTALKEASLYLEISPSFWNGQREYHYNLKTPVVRPVLIGTINPNGNLTLIIKERNWNADLQPSYRDLIILTAKMFSTGNVSDQLILDSVSCDVLESCFGKRPAEGPLVSLLTFF